MGLTLFTRRVRLSTDGSGYSLENSGKGYVSKGTNNIILFCLETELLHPTQGTTLSIILDYFLPSLFTSVPIDLPLKHIWNAQFFFFCVSITTTLPQTTIIYPDYCNRPLLVACFHTWPKVHCLKYSFLTEPMANCFLSLTFQFKCHLL